jgi:outer membrane receptor protein involved in Fe transport
VTTHKYIFANKKNKTMKRIFLFSALLLVMGLKAQEKDQDTIKMNEVIIDAGKTNLEKQQIPISVSTLSAKEIEILKIDNLTNLNGLVPNLFMPEHGTRLNTDIYIRGIGVSKGEPSVGVYVDDIPYFDSGTVNFELADVKKIEVLRGPQGTLYGRNTMGGLIKIYTPEPGPKTGGMLKLDYGNYNQQKAVGSVNLPVNNKLGVLLDGAYAHKDGFFTNEFDGSNPDRMDTYSGRMKMAYKATDKLNMRFVLGYEKNKQDGFPYAVYDINTQTAQPINYNVPSLYDRDFLSSGFFMNYEGESFDVTLSGSYQNLKDKYAIDQDFLPVDVYFIDMARDNDAYVEELNFKSKADSKIKWIAGLYSMQRRLFKDVLVDLTTQRGNMKLFKTYDQNIDGGAVFGQMEVPFGKFTFTGGLRWDMEKSRMDYNYDLEIGGHKMHKDDFIHYLSYNQILPKFSLTYFANEDINLYTSITKGYKAGGFNATIERPEDEIYNPEYSWNYEAGIKSVWMNDRLTANLSVFYIDWKDQQVIQSVPSGRGIMTKNAGKSESKGIEFESSFKLNKNFSMGLSAGYTDAKFITYEKNATTDYSGNKIPLVPKYTFGEVNNYKLYLKNSKIKYVLFNTTFKYFGKFYWDVDNVAYQKAYGTLSANISANTGKFTFGVWGKNLTNADYNRYYFTISTLNKAYVEPAQPMQFGAFVKVKF